MGWGGPMPHDWKSYIGGNGVLRYYCMCLEVSKWFDFFLKHA